MQKELSQQAKREHEAALRRQLDMAAVDQTLAKVRRVWVFFDSLLAGVCPVFWSGFGTPSPTHGPTNFLFGL